MRGSNFIFDFIQLYYEKCNKIIFKRGESYKDSSNWIKHKKKSESNNPAIALNVL